MVQVGSKNILGRAKNHLILQAENINHKLNDNAENIEFINLYADPLLPFADCV